MKIILKDIEKDDLILGIRAAKWLLERTHKDACVAYGEGESERWFYVKRNKASITVRPTQ